MENEPAPTRVGQDDIHFIRFNQDCTSLVVGTSSGYKLYSLNSLDKLEVVFVAALNDPGDRVTIVERLFSSSLIAIVSQSAPRKLKVCHFKKGTEICNYSYSNTILGVKLNRARLVVCLEEALYIHNIRDMRILHTIKDTPPNPRGLCALSINSDNCFLAYPGSNTTGEVQLFDAFNLHSKLTIPAHDSTLAAITFNPAGTRLATASEKGTVIRVFSVEDGEKLIEFRRGVKRCALVHSLSFSQDSQFLVLSSNTETIHIFKMEEKQPEEHQAVPNPDDASWIGYFNKAVSTTASYLPAQVTDTLNQARAVATVSVPPNLSARNLFNTVAIANISRQMRLLLAAADGYLYIYNLPGSEGGECVLVKQHRIDPDCSGGNPESAPPTSTSPTPGKVERSTPIATKRAEQYGSGDEADGPEHSPPGDAEDGEGPAVLRVTKNESHSPQSLDDSPPPAWQRSDM